MVTNKGGFRVFRPSKNLGEFGIRMGLNLYVGFFRRPYLGIFIRSGPEMYWVNIREMRISTNRY